jgi:hypothetical protein
MGVRMKGYAGFGWCGRVERKMTDQSNWWIPIECSSGYPQTAGAAFPAADGKFAWMGPERMRSLELFAMNAPAFMPYLFKPLEAS